MHGTFENLKCVTKNTKAENGKTRKYKEKKMETQLTQKMAVAAQPYQVQLYLTICLTKVVVRQNQ